MAATTDIRFKRMQGEYQVLHEAQDELFDKVDTLESAVLGLTEMVAENRREIAEIRQSVNDLNEKMDRLMKHLDVPPKPPAGFVKE